MSNTHRITLDTPTGDQIMDIKPQSGGQIMPKEAQLGDQIMSHSTPWRSNYATKSLKNTRTK